MSLFRPSPTLANFLSVSQTAQLPYPTDDSRLISLVAREAARQLYRPGYAFLKAGVGLIEIVDKRYQQFDLLHRGQSKQADRLMLVMDQINHREGRGTVFLAAQGMSKPWYMRQQYRSPQYTTQWGDIPKVKA